jgi:predicted amidohydrolase
MKISIVQTDIFWEEKVTNLEKLEKELHTLAGNTDLVILPEMFNTGFSNNVMKLGEEPGAYTYKWMKNQAGTGDFGICGSFIVGEGGRFFNRWHFIGPKGNSYVYDKRHLFSPGNENKVFTAGTSRVVFSFRGVRICPNVCYDLRFPVWSRNRNDYDLLINSASWPESRRDVWIALLKARAIENQCYVAGANRIGTDGNNISHSGESVIFGPRGEIISLGRSNEEYVISGEISISDLNSFRGKFPVMNDSDDFTINI